MIKHRDIHCRNAVSSGALLFLDGRHHLNRIELLEENHRRAVIYATHHSEDAAETMKERNRDADTVAAREILAGSNPKAVVGYAAVCELNAFGKTSCAGSILHIDDIVYIAQRLPHEIIFL